MNEEVVTKWRLSGHEGQDIRLSEAEDAIDPQDSQDGSARAKDGMKRRHLWDKTTIIKCIATRQTAGELL
jgi:hypothetical protein